jgi:acyl-CoA synthetase (AMP-forming)/AMP-acid ligase II/acyl carrier protein
LLTAQAERRAGACAIQTPSAEELSYGDLHQRINNISSQLRALGLGRRSRVVIVLPNGLNMSVMLLAVTSTSIAAPLNPSYREAEFQSYLNDIHADCVIVLAEDHRSPVRVVARKNNIPIFELASDGVSLMPPSGAVDVLGRRESSSSTNDDFKPRPDDTALILLTSGSTGRSKKVPLTHRNLCASVADICYSLNLDDRDICLSMWEQFHIGGMVDLLLVPLASGGRIICTSSFEAEIFFQILETRSPTWFQGVPTTLHEILAVARKTGRAPAKTSLRFIRSVASALSPQLMDRIESFFQVPVVQTFGMTEAGPLITTNPLPPGIRKAGSTGPSCGPMISIRDPNGRELSPSETGEILVRGENVVAGYEGNKEATAQSFRDGWFHTGDTGYLDADGYLFLKGRIKEQINRGGEKIIPQEIDDVLAAHPEIEQAASFSMKHATLGEDVGAAVVIRENSSLDESAIRRYVASQLSDFKVPKTILFLPSLPRSTIGKVKRDTLAALAESGSETLPYASPETKLHEILAKAWAEELGVKKVGIDDDFFRLGGDSLSSIRLALAIETLLGIELDAASLTEILTVRQLARLIESLPNYDQILNRIAKHAQTAAFTDSRIRDLLSNIATGHSGGASTTPDTTEGIKDALLKCDTEHAFDALLESFYSELTPTELAPLSQASLTAAELLRPVKHKFLSTQNFLADKIVPLALKQSWRRQSLAKSVRLYTSSGVDVQEKTLIVGFGSMSLRLMMPMWTFLSHLDSKKVDLLFLWDPSRIHYREGIPELGDNFRDLVTSLENIVSHFGYRRIIGFGASAGALPAICAGIANRWDSIVAVGSDYPKFQKHLLPMLAPHSSDEVLAKKPRIRLYYSEFHKWDHVSALTVEKITKGESRALIGCKAHAGLWEIYQRGELGQLFVEFFGEAASGQTYIGEQTSLLRRDR